MFYCTSEQSISQVDFTTAVDKLDDYSWVVGMSTTSPPWTRVVHGLGGQGHIQSMPSPWVYMDPTFIPPSICTHSGGFLVVEQALPMVTEVSLRPHILDLCSGTELYCTTSNYVHFPFQTWHHNLLFHYGHFYYQWYKVEFWNVSRTCKI